MPSSWEKKKVLCGFISAPVHPAFSTHPVAFETEGSMEKWSDSWETSLELATHPKANSSFSAARRCRRPPPHAADELNGHSTGTVGREAALRHGVTSAQRILNPLPKSKLDASEPNRSGSALLPLCQSVTAYLSRARARSPSRRPPTVRRWRAELGGATLGDVQPQLR